MINLIEYLTQVLNDDQWVYEETGAIMINDGLSLDNKLLLDIISKLHERKERDYFWENLLHYLPQQYLSQNVFDYLLENKIGLITLAHMDLDDKQLKKLVTYAEEALFTLAKRYYSKKEYSPANFAIFLYEYNNDVLLDQLRSLQPDDSIKEQILYYFYSKNEKQRSKINKLIESKCLEITNDSFAIERAYKCAESIYNVALSRNIFTPIDILDSLKNISGIENASIIRRNSRDTLVFKKYLDGKQVRF